MVEAFENFFKYRSIIKATTFEGLRGRFTGNVFGFIWLLLYPLLFLAMYSVVFYFILGVRIPGLNTMEYIVTIFCGLVPFLAFSEAFSTGTLSIVSNRSLLKNTLFPIEFIIARDVILGHATMCVGMLLVWVTVIITNHLNWTQLLVPFIYVVQIMMTLGIVWITSTFIIFFRDLQQAIPVFILFLMLVSPIAYTNDMVPHAMKALIFYNPLAWLMHIYRACLLEGFIPFKELFLFTVFSVSFFVFGYYVVSRLKTVLLDYV